MAIGTQIQNIAYSYDAQKTNSVLYQYVTGYLYTYVSKFLSNGLHAVQISAVDDLDNESVILSGTITIDTYLRPARNFQGRIASNGSMNLMWNVSPDDQDAEFSKYNLYDNNGSGEIDFSAPTTQLAASVTTYNTGVVANGDWKFCLRVEKTDGKIEENLTNVWRIKKPAVPNQAGMPGAIDNDTDLIVVPKAGGTALIQFIYPYVDADSFRIYWNDVGADIANFTIGSPQETFTRQNAVVQEHTTARITYSEDKEYWFLVRAYNSAGEETNTDVVNVTLDGKTPAKPSALSLVAVADNEQGYRT